jgi:hypothetical protein
MININEASDEVKDDIKEINESCYKLKSAIEDLNYLKIFPTELVTKIEEIASEICNYIPHQWEFGGCNHMEHMYCLRCNTTITTPEQFKEARKMHPNAIFGVKNALFEVFEEFTAED